MSSSLLRQLPAVDQWLASEPGATLCAEFSHAEVVEVMRVHLARIRDEITDGAGELPALESPEYCALLRADLVEARQSSLRRTINATGIIIHTNLGRSPLAPEALRAIDDVAKGYSNLELELVSGERGSRYAHVESLLTRLTGAEAALVVNNCAGAIMLALRASAKDAEVVISRGELIEIGGSFRMPDVIAESGARMVEVGTTNKTSLADYANAINENTRVLLASHPSNYRIVGFTSKPSLSELAELAHRNDLFFVQDLGSGNLVDLGTTGLNAEPTVGDSIAQGVDLVTFSGDKLLGGPQAGVIVGRTDCIDAIKRSAMLRALRIDKLSLAALSATLHLYLPPNDPFERVPVLRMLSESKTAIGRRATNLLKQLREHADLEGSIEDDTSYAGGGALPMNQIPTRVIRLKIAGLNATELARRLRAGDPPVIGRVANDAFIVDLRTVMPKDGPDLVAAIGQAIQ